LGFNQEIRYKIVAPKIYKDKGSYAYLLRRFGEINMKERIPLVVISNNHAYRYVNGKLDQSLKIDPMCVSQRQLRRDIEQFRVYGIEVDNEQ
jgi:hypothetical protein